MERKWLNVTQSEGETQWSSIGLNVFINTISYPVEYVKVLIQIGYEPLPPRETRTFFLRKRVLGLPNVIQYIKYIYTVDGFYGCFRGVGPKLCAYTLNAIATEKTTNYINKFPTYISEFCDEDNRDEDNDAQWDVQHGDEGSEPKCKRCLFELIRNLVSRTVGIIVSHPLEVITVRMMSQFVGRETKYNGLFESFGEIYRQNGVTGFYAGLVPRLLGNAATLIIFSTSTYLINKYIIRDRIIRDYTASTMSFVASTLTYPFLVVSNCMAVNNSGLAAGCPPHMPIYDNWIHCWKHLQSMNQLKRGSIVFRRYYTGPRAIVNGRLVPLEVNVYQRMKME